MRLEIQPPGEEDTEPRWLLFIPEDDSEFSRSTEWGYDIQVALSRLIPFPTKKIREAAARNPRIQIQGHAEILSMSSWKAIQQYLKST